MSAPRVVLGLPAFKRPDTLARTFESLLSQTCRDFAIVVVDDANSEETRAIVESFASEYPHIHFPAQWDPKLGIHVT